MSRERLYKAKRANCRELPKEEWWVEGALFEGKENSYIFTNVKVTDKWENSGIGADVIGYLVDPETVCEYTELTNKNGRKIFEGDIVSEKQKGIKAIRCEIVWDKEEGAWMRKAKSGAKYSVGTINSQSLERIGNIFDNPELLEGDEAE